MSEKSISYRVKSISTFVLGALLLVNPATGLASLETSKPEAQGVSSEKLQRLSELSQQYVDEGRVAGIVNLVVRNGEVIHYEATGNRGADNPAPMQVDDLFRIYSMTKPITAVAAMQLYEQGKFQLTDPVSKFVPELKDLMVLDAAGEFVPAAREMTMHQLLMHTTGMSYGFAAATDAVDQRYAMADLWASKDLDELAARIGKLPLKFHPGDRWHYSVAVDITGIVVQRLSGQPFDEYLEEHIFAPLGMADTFFEVPESERERFVPNHFLNPETGALTNTKHAPPPFSYRDGVAMIDYFDVSLFSGGGGLVSTAMDYAKFSEMMRRGGSFNGARILGPKTVAFMTKNHLAEDSMLDSWGEKPTDDIGRPGFGFGLGFGVVTDSTAISIMGSDGEYNWGGAAGTVFWIDPVEELVVISMIQLMQSPWPLRSDVKVAVYQALSETYDK